MKFDPITSPKKITNPFENERKRLLLIGNGFDLAHGLKTNYSDFIHDYFVDKIEYSLKSK